MGIGILICKKRLKRHVLYVVELVAVKHAHQVDIEAASLRCDITFEFSVKYKMHIVSVYLNANSSIFLFRFR